MRYVVALGFLAALQAARRKPLRLPTRDLLLCALLGLTGIVGYHIFFFMSLVHTQVGNTAIINATSPVITGVLAALLLGERLSRRNVAGVVISVIGVLVLLLRGDIARLGTWDLNRGDLLMLISVLSWAIYSILARGLLRRHDPFVVTFHATLLGVLILVVPAFQEGLVAQASALSTTGILAILYMGVGASGLGYLLYNESIRRHGPTRTSTVVYGLLPIFVAALSAWWLDEAVTSVMIYSTPVIILGLILAMRSRTTARPEGSQS